MSIKYEQLYNLNLSQLNQAVTAWQETARKARQLQQDVSPDLVRPFNQAGWSSGDLTSSLAERSVKSVEQEFTDAHKVSEAIHSVLEESHGTLRAKKRQLHDLVSEETAKGDVRISPTGKITSPGQETGGPPYAPGTSDDNAVFAPDAAQKRVDAVAKRIQKVLDEAAEADDSAAAAIRYNIGNDGNVFHGRTAGSVEKAEGRYDAARARAKAEMQTDGWKSEGKTTATGPDVGASATGLGFGKQGMAKAYADLGHATAEGSLTNGDVKLSGIGDAYAGARASTSVGMTETGISGNAEASAGARALAEGRAEAGHYGMYGRATGFGGAEAGLDAGVSTDGLKVDGQAFAGAKGTVTGGVEAGGIGAGVTAEGWAGTGVEVKEIIGKGDDGKYHLGGKVGISPIVGGAVGYEFTVDPDKVADAASDAADTVGDAAGTVKDTASDLF